MSKRTLGMLLLSVSLAVALAGCGGGGGGKSTPARILSNDYYGMEVGAKYSYHTTYTDKFNNTLSHEFNLDAVVYSVDNSTPGTSIYKVGAKTEGSTNIEGEYVAKITLNNAVTYRSYGTWANDGSDNYNSINTDFLMSNPITAELSGSIVRQESVTVPAGTFNTYVLRNTVTSKDGIEVQTTDYWFVPGIYDFVKKVEDYTKNGVAQSSTLTVLTKTQFGVDTTIPVAAIQTKLSAKTVSAYSVLRPYRKN